jgi:hypothetical protein
MRFLCSDCWARDKRVPATSVVNDNRHVCDECHDRRGDQQDAAFASAYYGGSAPVNEAERNRR